MEVLDKDGNLIAWCSDDPDDFNSFSDYELKIRRMVIDYNEEAFCIGSPLLGFHSKAAIKFIKMLASINPNYTSDTDLQEKIREIRKWSYFRITSRHPDELDEPRLSQKAKEHFNNARKYLKSGRIDKAIEFYEKAALYDHPSAYKTLGDLYKDGLGGLQRDIRTAMRYYEMGAEDEIGDCALVLGTLYRDSADGLSPDKELAYKWIRQAALLGSKNGRMELAKYFENGLGCETNLRKALYWYDLSIIGIWDGNRIRSILRHQKDELSLKLDGFCYETGHFMQEASWWKEYYIKNNMIED